MELSLTNNTNLQSIQFITEVLDYSADVTSKIHIHL